jgi:phytoene dehydrogenase-like protein
MIKIKNNQSQPDSLYDVIVIGAGLGGLGAACQLALAEKKVLLLEKYNVPGGFATSFVRGRFEFEGALHVLSDIGTEDNRGSLYQFFEQLGIFPEKLKYKDAKEYYRSVFYDGYDVIMPLGVDQFYDKLIELFPAETEAIKRFKIFAQKIEDGFHYVASKGGKASPLSILIKHPWLARIGGFTLKEVFKRFFKDKRLMAVLAQVWGYDGLPPSQLNALYFIITLMSLLHSAVFPVGRSHALTSNMINALEELGGEVRFNALVNRILVENGRVSGVELLNGDKYYSKAVISNVNPICTTMKMLPENVVSEKYKKRIYAPKIGNSAFSVYLGLNTPPEKLGLTTHETFINSTDDMDDIYQTVEKLETPKILVAACYNKIDKNISPPGTTQLVLTTIQMGNVWHSVSPDQYHRIKDKIADDLVSMVEKTISPNLRDYIEVAEVATPVTYYRYSKNMDGAIYGYTQSIMDSPMLRLSSHGAIPGLYLAGAWIGIGGGFSPSINSGRMAAGAYLQDLKKKRW